MKAIILGAGIGSRLKPITEEIPKPLVNINEKITLLDYQINVINKILKIDLNDIAIVAGYKIEKIKDFIKKYDGVSIIENKFYKEYNNIYSLYLSRQFINGDSFYLFNGDTFLPPEVFKKFSNSNHENSLFIIDNEKNLGFEEMKVLIKENKIIKFGKDIDPKISGGEFVGICMINKKDFPLIFDTIKNKINSGSTDIWYELAFNDILDRVNFKPFFINGIDWVEVDTKEDYLKLKRIASNFNFEEFI